MNEQLEKFAKQAPLLKSYDYPDLRLVDDDQLERFADLVRQDERDKHAEQIKNLKDICMVAGFLLNKLNITCAMSFGMQEQVHNCINDCNNVIDTKNNHEQD